MFIKSFFATIAGTVLVAGITGTSSLAAPMTVAEATAGALSFEIDPPLVTGPGSNTGTSNGVGYTVTFDGHYAPFASTTGGSSYPGLPGSYDKFHFSADFTITFDSAVSAVLVALSNDASFGVLTDGPDFGVAAKELTGDLTQGPGTKLHINSTSGGLALFTFGSPTTTFSHTNDCPGGTNVDPCDGWNMSFFAFADDTGVVPLPAGMPLMLAGLGVLALASRRRKV